MSLAPLPTAAQVTQTRACIRAHHDDVYRTERQIQDLESQIAALREQIARIHNDVALKEAFIAPIRRLPFEVLGEVAVISATDPDADVQVVRTLSSVCRAWRDATIRTPRVWSKIVFRYSATPVSPRTRLCSLRDVCEWFERCAACPKDVDLHLMDLHFAEMPEVQVDTVCDMLATHAAELRSLSISFGFRTAEASIKQLDWLSRPMPLLEHVDFTSSIGRLDQAARDALVHAAPRLARIAAWDFKKELSPGLCTRLASLAVTNATLPGLLSALRASTGLQRLSVGSLTDLHAVPDTETPIQTELRVLYLDLQEKPAPSVFRVLQFPHLQTLALKTRSFDQARKKDVFAVLDSLVTTSNPPLIELRLKSFCISDSDLLKLLGQLPALERLVLLAAKTSDKVCEALSSPRPKHLGWICPRLTHLCFSTDSSVKSDKFRVSRAAMETLATKRRAYQNVGTLAGLRLETSTLRQVASQWEWEDDPDDELHRYYAGNLFSTPVRCIVGAWWQVSMGPDL